MKKKFLYLSVGVLAFSIGLAIVFFFAFRPSYDLETSKNFCQKCVDFSKTESIETKTLSEIINNKDFYGKKVRVKARFIHDAGYIFLKDLEDKNSSIPTGFDKNAILCADTEKTLQVCTGYKTWYDSNVEVTVIGYLGTIDKDTNPFQGDYDGFNITCLEQVNATDEEIKRGKTAFEQIW